ncbi:hypothetical protein NPIL_664051 [Nephila pilipes]|uniref:Uncharacterized protein n=1 Tax=Nephila pilipes TaxID=299642 RepID=A0A8X6UF33_NEPPI|nr:hypothetical protein NPIL_664051 [Nephila pilipes]
MEHSDESRSSSPSFSESHPTHCIRRREIENLCRDRACAKIKEGYRNQLALYNSFNYDIEYPEYIEILNRILEKENQLKQLEGASTFMHLKGENGFPILT